jgi:hypothetical protein
MDVIFLSCLLTLFLTGYTRRTSEPLALLVVCSKLWSFF